MNRIKVLCLLLTLFFPIMSNSSGKINLEEYINSFSWDKRIVLLVTKEKDIHFIKETDDFIKRLKSSRCYKFLDILRLK